jgi:hypothetical protein
MADNIFEIKQQAKINLYFIIYLLNLFCYFTQLNFMLN